MDPYKKEDLQELVEKFGIIQNVHKEDYDKIKNTVFKEHVNWEESAGKNDDLFFQATVNSQAWKLRINNFPDEPMYTLLINDKAMITFDDRPDTWTFESKTSKNTNS